ncbi:GSCOCG00000573001-RA-CDS [Cotesia congregata]|nr:GSCOCG00000573001-RA-CDS [Cotesia congregata]
MNYFINNGIFISNILFRVFIERNFMNNLTYFFFNLFRIYLFFSVSFFWMTFSLLSSSKRFSKIPKSSSSLISESASSFITILSVPIPSSSTELISFLISTSSTLLLSSTLQATSPTKSISSLPPRVLSSLSAISASSLPSAASTSFLTSC